MSTILDALRKVERDREVPRDELLDVELPKPRARRGISTRVIIACASVGFAAGIGLALWRDTAPLQQASAPEAVAPAVVDVPPPPPPRPKRAGKVPITAPVAQEANPAGAPAGTHAATEPTGGVSAPAAAAPPVVASVDRDASALEPSPFAAAQGGAPAAVPAPPQAAAPPPPRAVAPRRGHKSPGRPVEPRAGVPLAPQPPAAVAALAPPPPVPPVIPAPPAEAPPPAEPETLHPPSNVIDTGRSPPGSPRVALTFLQWSADPERRFAFISIDGAPSLRVREGDSASGMVVAQITPTGVQFQREGQTFIIRPRH